MNYFKRIRSFRLICYVLAFLMGTPTITLLAPVPAAAQLPDLVEVAVVDFINRTGVGGDYIGKLASDALVVELKRSDRFDVSTRASVQAGMDDMGFRAPLSHTQLLRLGQTILKGDVGQTSAMVEGDVTSLKVKGNPRTAEVEMIVRMVDVASGEFINGAVTTGRSQLRIGDNPDDDRLIEEAVNDAAYKAVNTMVDYIIPEATVMNTMGTNDILLNKGAREGIKRGMKMIVFRRGELVGKIEVMDVTPNDATASVIHAPKGVKPEDKVRAVFDVPVVHGKGGGVEEAPAKESRAPKSSRRGGSRGGSGMLKGLVLLAGLAFLFNPGRGTEDVGAVTARAGLSPDIPSPEGGVKVSWNIKKLGGGRNILEYHIWRDNDPTPIGSSIPAGLTFFIDDVGAGTRSVTYQVVDPNLNTKTSATAAVNRPATGVPHQYYVSAVYEIEKPAGTGTFKYFETDKTPTGLATVTRRMLVGPSGDLVQPSMGATDVDLVSGINFQFNSRQGADTYIIQVSTSPIFTAPEFTSSIIQYSPAIDNATILFDSGDISALFGALTEGTQLWWRVGARNSLDRPGPLPNLGRANMNFLFSDPSNFAVAATPPPPP